MQPIEKELKNLKEQFSSFKKQMTLTLGNIDRENLSEALQYSIFTKLNSIEERLSALENK